MLVPSAPTSPRGELSPRLASSRRILSYSPDGQPLNPEDENSMKNHLFYAVERADLEHTWSVLAVHEVNTLSLLFAGAPRARAPHQGPQRSG